MYISTCIHIHVYMFIYIYINRYTYIYTYTHTYVYAYIHTHAWSAVALALWRLATYGRAAAAARGNKFLSVFGPLFVVVALAGLLFKEFNLNYHITDVNMVSGLWYFGSSPVCFGMLL